MPRGARLGPRSGSGPRARIRSLRGGVAGVSGFRGRAPLPQAALPAGHPLERPPGGVRGEQREAGSGVRPPFYTAEDIGSYKPDPRNFRYMLDHLARDHGAAKDRLLHTAESLFHDCATARSLGLATAWIHRRSAAGGFGATRAVAERPEVDFYFTSLAEMADAHRNETWRKAVRRNAEEGNRVSAARVVRVARSTTGSHSSRMRAIAHRRGARPLVRRGSAPGGVVPRRRRGGRPHPRVLPRSPRGASQRGGAGALASVRARSPCGGDRPRSVPAPPLPGRIRARSRRMRRPLGLAKEALARGFDRKSPRRNESSCISRSSTAKIRPSRRAPWHSSPPWATRTASTTRCGTRWSSTGFGRFPHRNEALGRPSTPEEIRVSEGGRTPRSDPNPAHTAPNRERHGGAPARAWPSPEPRPGAGCRSVPALPHPPREAISRHP